MSDIVLGLGDYDATSEPGTTLKTHALGSCVAVIIQDAKKRAAGMIHVVLPSATCNPGKAASQPGYFADTGIPALLQRMKEIGCVPNGRGLTVKLAGGAQVMDPNGVFNIGKRNILAVKKILWKYRMGAISEDVGGRISRTVTVDAATGKVVVSSPGRGNWEL